AVDGHGLAVAGRDQATTLERRLSARVLDDVVEELSGDPQDLIVRSSSSSSSSGRVTPLMDSLNSRMPWPSERPTSGSFLGPITTRAMMSTRISSPGPMLLTNGMLLGYLRRLVQHEKVLRV